MLLEFTFYTVVRNDIGLHCLSHAAVWISFADRTHESVFAHESADLLVIHADARMQKSHIYAAYAFVVSAESVGLQD